MTARGQTDYLAPKPAIAGMLPSTGPKFDAAAFNAEASAAMRFGIWVQQDSSSVKGKKLLSTVNDEPIGVTGFHHTYDRLNELDDTTGGVIPNVDIAVRQFGLVWVRVEGEIAYGDRAYVRAVAGAGGTVLGVARADAVGGETIDCSNLGMFVGEDDGGTTPNRFAPFFIDTFSALSVPEAGSVIAAHLSSQLLADIVDDIEFTVGAETSHAIAVTVQLEDPADANVTGKRLITWWLSDSSAGALASSAPSGGAAVTGTGAVAINEEVTDKTGRAVTGTSGSLVITVTEATAKTFYLNVICGDGAVHTATLTFAG